MKVTDVISAFKEGMPKKKGNIQSTGVALYYYGNKIAEWREDGLYISNGRYEGSRGETGSKTTKAILNYLLGESIIQRNFKWYLNGIEWDGGWIKVEGVSPPKIDRSKEGSIFITQTKYVKIDEWRGYEEPEFAVAGVNDTGSYEDSPYPSNIVELELLSVETVLKREGIKVKKLTYETSNVFCVHHYLIPMLKDVERAREIVKDYIDNTGTRLLYLVE